MKERECNTWEQFEAFLGEIEDKRQKAIANQGGSVSQLLFRGQENARWLLSTTLERDSNNLWSSSKYFQLVSDIQAEIETFTQHHWQIADWSKPVEKENKIGTLTEEILGRYDYLVYLRHHRFPSPLLDWTQSPYIAAYFAFADAKEDHVAIYVYLEYLGSGKVNSLKKTRILTFGHNVRSHPRHFVQQSEYTIGARYDKDEWWFSPHEKVFASGSTEQDCLWKCIIPASERSKVLKILDSQNLNKFSLFQPEESLLRTIAIRELEICDTNF